MKRPNINFPAYPEIYIFTVLVKDFDEMSSECFLIFYKDLFQHNIFHFRSASYVTLDFNCNPFVCTNLGHSQKLRSTDVLLKSIHKKICYFDVLL